jgi:hypothetical protein
MIKVISTAEFMKTVLPDVQYEEVIERIGLLGLTFWRTCEMCPEQYDVCLGDGDKQVAYVRLRHSLLTVHMPDVNGELIYDHEFDEPNRGSFHDDDERDDYLYRIATHINARLMQNKTF